MEIKIQGISKPSREPDIDSTFMSDPNIPDEVKQEVLDEMPIKYLSLIKHFPYHNIDHTVLVDEEFGKELVGFIYHPPEDCDSDFRNIIDTLPDLTQIVRIPGNGFNRDIAICSTVIKAKEIRDTIMELDKIEQITMEKRLYPSKIQKVRL